MTKVTPMNHPNLVAVKIDSKNDLLLLAAEMKRAALEDPCMEPHQYSKNEDELKEKLKHPKGTVDPFRFTRHAFLFERHFITLACSFDKFDEESGQWRLSMGELVRKHNKDGLYSIKVIDDVADFICSGILGEGYREEENPSGVMPHIRIFVKEA